VDLFRAKSGPRGPGSYLRGDEELVAPPRDGLADQSLGPASPVHLGRVDPVDARVEPCLNGLDDLLIRLVRTPGFATGLPGAEADHR
jgi:hypothetical protein